MMDPRFCGVTSVYSRFCGGSLFHTRSIRQLASVLLQPAQVSGLNL